MHTKQFLVFKDRLIEYLRSFIKGLQRNVGVIEECLRMQDKEMQDQIFHKIVEYELLIPRMDIEISEDWSTGKQNLNVWLGNGSSLTKTVFLIITGEDGSKHMLVINI